MGGLNCGRIGRSLVLFVLFLWCCTFIAVVPAAYFRLEDYIPICFTEEVGLQSEVVSVEFHRRRSSTSEDIPVSVTVSTPTTRSVISTHRVREGRGSFTFRPLANEVGQYDVCFFAPSLEASAGRHVEIAVAIDHHDRKVLLPKPEPAVTRQKANGQEVFSFVDFGGQVKDTLRTHDYLDRVRTQLEGIGGALAEARNEVTYFRGRTDEMRSTSESTFSRVWGFSVVTISVVVAVAWVQYSFLKQFLRAKKRV